MPSGGEGAAGDAGDVGARRVARSFKLRFAVAREPGRSNVSAVRPLSLPARVTDKVHAARGRSPVDPELVSRAERRVAEALKLGPRERHRCPVTSAHEYGWWCVGGASRRAECEEWWRIRDSAWMKGQLRVLKDDKLAH